MTYKHLLAGSIVQALTLLGAPAALHAGNVVVSVNGTQAERTLKQITFEGDNVVLHFADATPGQTEPMNTVAITLPASTHIDRATTLTTGRLSADELSLVGIARGERVALYDGSGRLRMQTTAPGGDMSLSVAGLRPGVYVVKAGSKIVKFQKK